MPLQNIYSEEHQTWPTQKRSFNALSKDTCSVASQRDMQTQKDPKQGRSKGTIGLSRYV